MRVWRSETKSPFQLWTILSLYISFGFPPCYLPCWNRHFLRSLVLNKNNVTLIINPTGIFLKVFLMFTTSLFVSGKYNSNSSQVLWQGFPQSSWNIVFYVAFLHVSLLPYNLCYTEKLEIPYLSSINIFCVVKLFEPCI